MQNMYKTVKHMWFQKLGQTVQIHGFNIISKDNQEQEWQRRKTEAGLQKPRKQDTEEEHQKTRKETKMLVDYEYAHYIT